jgi:hypothetical protein
MSEPERSYRSDESPRHWQVEINTSFLSDSAGGTFATGE